MHPVVSHLSESTSCLDHSRPPYQLRTKSCVCERLTYLFSNMATMTESVAAPPTGPDQPSSDTDAAALPYDFAFKDFLRKEYQFGLSISQPYCKAFREGHCPLGKGRCPDKHPITLSHSTLICKHWLRGLCKKGESCDFSHEYNLRKMQECINFTRTLFCPNGDECVYLHIDPASKLPPCPHYDKGFCPLGPNCSKKHVRKTLCPFYLAGFCPYGPKCEKGAHPRWKEDLPKPTVKVEKTAEEVERERYRIQEEGEREDERERERRDGNRRDGRGRGGKGRYGQGRRGRY